MRTPVSIGVVGLDSLAIELAQTFDELPQAQLARIYDPRPSIQLRASRRFPRAATCRSADDILDDETVDAIVLAAAAPGRALFARRALEAGKHVLMRGPLALDGAEADDLVQLAASQDRRLLVENAALFLPELRKLKELIELGRLGELFYVSAEHTDPSDLSHAESVVWTLGAPPVSLLLYLLDDEPVEVVARADAFVHESADVVFCHFRFATGIVAHLQLSRLDRRHARRIEVVGSNRMAVYDGLDPYQPLAVDQSRLTIAADGTAAVRIGDIVSPRAVRAWPMRLQCEHFVAAIRAPADTTPTRRDAAVVRILEALQRSGCEEGAAVGVDEPAAFETGVIELSSRR